MGKLVLGLFIGVAVGWAAQYYWFKVYSETVEACAGLCGDGTRCHEGACIPEAEYDKPTAKKRVARRDGKRARRKSKKKRSSFRPVDDSGVPSFVATRTKILDMNGGSERLSDRDIQTHMRRIESHFNACLEVAAAHSERELAGGTIALHLGIAGSGKVTGVKASAPPNLRVFGIVPCIRLAVHKHRFPTFAGPEMAVEYRFTVD